MKKEYIKKANYIKKNNLNIEFHQEYGGEPAGITPVETMPELLK